MNKAAVTGPLSRINLPVTRRRNSWTVLGRLIGGGANVVTAQYLRRVVPGRVTLGAEYQAQLGAGSQVRK